MKLQSNARFTLHGRPLLVRRVSGTDGAGAAAEAAGLSARTAASGWLATADRGLARPPTRPAPRAHAHVEWRVGGPNGQWPGRRGQTSDGFQDWPIRNTARGVLGSRDGARSLRPLSSLLSPTWAHGPEHPGAQGSSNLRPSGAPQRLDELSDPAPHRFAGPRSPLAAHHDRRDAGAGQRAAEQSERYVHRRNGFERKRSESALRWLARNCRGKGR
jgi:hypothetical protein